MRLATTLVLGLLLSAGNVDAQVRVRVEGPATEAVTDIAAGRIPAVCLLGESTESSVTVNDATSDKGCVGLPNTVAVAVRAGSTCAIPLDIQRQLAFAGIRLVLLYCPSSGEWTPFWRSERPPPESKDRAA